MDELFDTKNYLLTPREFNYWTQVMEHHLESLNGIRTVVDIGTARGIFPVMFYTYLQNSGVPESELHKSRIVGIEKNKVLNDYISRFIKEFPLAKDSLKLIDQTDAIKDYLPKLLNSSIDLITFFGFAEYLEDKQDFHNLIFDKLSYGGVMTLMPSGLDYLAIENFRKDPRFEIIQDNQTILIVRKKLAI